MWILITIYVEFALLIDTTLPGALQAKWTSKLKYFLSLLRKMFLQKGALITFLTGGGSMVCNK